MSTHTALDASAGRRAAVTIAAFAIAAPLLIDQPEPGSAAIDAPPLPVTTHQILADRHDDHGVSHISFAPVAAELDDLEREAAQLVTAEWTSDPAVAAASPAAVTVQTSGSAAFAFDAPGQRVDGPAGLISDRPAPAATRPA